MHRGFTLVEMLVVMGVVGVLLALGLPNLLGSQRKSQMNSALTALVSDLREQRIKAMTGDTEGTGVISSYGIYFGTNAYTVFRGSSYVADSPSNFVVGLDPTLLFTNVTFPGNTVVFTDGSGEVAGWSSSADSVAVTDVNQGVTKTITINKYGVPVAIN